MIFLVEKSNVRYSKTFPNHDTTTTMCCYLTAAVKWFKSRFGTGCTPSRKFLYCLISLLNLRLWHLGACRCVCQIWEEGLCFYLFFSQLFLPPWTKEPFWPQSLFLTVKVWTLPKSSEPCTLFQVLLLLLWPPFCCVLGLIDQSLMGIFFIVLSVFHVWITTCAADMSLWRFQTETCQRSSAWWVYVWHLSATYFCPTASVEGIS